MLCTNSAFITAWKESVFGVILVRIFPAFSPIQTEYREILRKNAFKNPESADQNNSEYGHFLRSVYN